MASASDITPSGHTFDVTEIIPLAPIDIKGRVMKSSPDKTVNPFLDLTKISVACFIDPDASFIATIFGIWDNFATVSGSILELVHDGTL